MGFFSHLLGRDYDYEYEDDLEEDSGALPDLHNGMSLTVETPEGQVLLTGRITGYAGGRFDPDAGAASRGAVV